MIINKKELILKKRKKERRRKKKKFFPEKILESHGIVLQQKIKLLKIFIARLYINKIIILQRPPTKSFGISLINCLIVRKLFEYITLLLHNNI